jgi:hypothetical protein
LCWYRFAEVYLHTKLRVLVPGSSDVGYPAAAASSTLDDERLHDALAHALGEKQKLEMDKQQRIAESRLYASYSEMYPGKTFAYMGALQRHLLEVSRRGLEARQKKVLDVSGELQRRGLTTSGRRSRREAAPIQDHLKV